MAEIPEADWSWIDAAARRFEQAWKQGVRPRIEDFLAKVPEPRWPGLLAELLRVERELRQQAAEKPTAEEYRRRFPAHDDVVASVFDPGEDSPLATGRASLVNPIFVRSNPAPLLADIAAGGISQPPRLRDRPHAGAGRDGSGLPRP